MLRATAACTFSTSQLQKVVRTWCVLYIFTSKCASRHNGVHFFIFRLASWLRTRRFSEPTFRPSGATNHWKNTVNRDFPTFSRICIFFLLIFSLLTLLTSAFQLSILSEVSLLNFLRLLRYIPCSIPCCGTRWIAWNSLLGSPLNSSAAVQLPAFGADPWALGMPNIRRPRGHHEQGRCFLRYNRLSPLKNHTTFPSKPWTPGPAP